MLGFENRAATYATGDSGENGGNAGVLPPVTLVTGDWDRRHARETSKS
jgi:hypothetical protein